MASDPAATPDRLRAAGRRTLPPHDHRRKRGPRAPAGAVAGRSETRTGARAARSGGTKTRTLCGALAFRALRRSAPARRCRQGTCGRSADAPDGRTVWRARSRHPSRAPARVQPDAEAVGADGDSRDARYGLSLRAGRPDWCRRRRRARHLRRPVGGCRVSGSTREDAARDREHRASSRRDVMSGLLRFWQTHAAELARLTAQHVVLVAVSTASAAVIAIPAGILAFHRPRLGRPLLVFANVAQTIPSLALFGFLLPLPFIGGIGPRTALVTLTLYACLPIVRTTVGGLRSLDRAVVDAGVAMGMTPRQLLVLVELPLAMPSIVAGLRVATVIGVGTATIAAAIGAGGLGEYIFRGLSVVDTTVLLAGAVPAAALALIADLCLAWLEDRMRRRRVPWRPLAIAAVVMLAIATPLAWSTINARASRPVVIGSKNFTEQIV